MGGINCSKCGDEEVTLLCCPFCGAEPFFPEARDVIGTSYEAGCEECGVASISVQVIDCFDYGESPNIDDVRNSWDSENIKYDDKFITVARNKAINQWNTRV